MKSKAAPRGDLRQGHGPAEMLQPVEPRGEGLLALGHHARLQQHEPAIDAVGRDDHGLAVAQHPGAQLGQAVVRRDEGVATGSIARQLAYARKRPIAADEVGNELREIEVIARIRQGDIRKTAPNLLPDHIRGRHRTALPSACFAPRRLMPSLLAVLVGRPCWPTSLVDVPSPSGIPTVSLGHKLFHSRRAVNGPCAVPSPRPLHRRPATSGEWHPCSVDGLK